MSNPTEGKCFHCNETLLSNGRCPQDCCTSEEGHEPDWKTTQLADGEAFGPGPKAIFDVNCKHCGLSGSVAVTFNVEDVNW